MSSRDDLLADTARRLHGQRSRFAPATYGIEPPEWTRSALCAQVDAELFFPEKGGSTREAKAICAACTVRDECLEWALDVEVGATYVHGVYGGLSAAERIRMKRRGRSA